MQAQKITEITKNKLRDLQLIYGLDVTCNRSIRKAAGVRLPVVTVISQ